jgi:hypothetical protein
LKIALAAGGLPINIPIPNLPTDLSQVLCFIPQRIAYACMAQAMFLDRVIDDLKSIVEATEDQITADAIDNVETYLDSAQQALRDTNIRVSDKLKRQVCVMDPNSLICFVINRTCVLPDLPLGTAY